MTTATERGAQGAVPARQVRLAEQVNVAVLFAGRQHDVTLPASSSVAAVVDSLVRRLQTADDGGEEGLRSPDENGMVSPGLVNLTHIDGRPLNRTQTLAQQGVVDGDLLVLEVIDADVEFTPVIESPSSAVGVLNKSRTPVVTAATARLVAGIIVAVAVAVTTGLLMLAWSRNRSAGDEWDLIPTAAAAGLGLLLIIAGALVWRQQRDTVTANALWLPGALIACPAAAFMAAPGIVGPWHITFAVMVAVVLAALLWRLSPAPRGLVATVVIVGTGLAALAVVHALTGATLQNLSVVVMVLALLIFLVPPLAFGGVWADWFYRALVLLVIACPCALVISTPVTVVSGLTAAARRGILIKGGAFLEQGQTTHPLVPIAYPEYHSRRSPRNHSRRHS